MSLRGLSEVGPVLISIRLVLSAAHGLEPVTITSQVFLCLSGPFPSSGGFIKHPSQFAIIFTLMWAGEININKAHCCRGEVKHPPFVTLCFYQSKTSEHQRSKAFHERKSGLNYKCSKGRVARENICRKLKYQPSIIWCNIAKINFWREQRPCCGECKKLSGPLPWARRWRM